MKKEYEITKGEKNAFEWAGGGEIIRVGNRNKVNKNRK